MSGVSLPVTRPIGRALVVANPSSRSQPLAVLQRLGYSCAEADDPYTAMLELCRKPLVYRALILSLSSLYKEELSFIESVKKRFPHVEVWLTQTDGRQGSLAESMRLGAMGFSPTTACIGSPSLPPPNRQSFRRASRWPNHLQTMTTQISPLNRLRYSITILQ